MVRVTFRVKHGNALVWMETPTAMAKKTCLHICLIFPTHTVKQPAVPLEEMLVMEAKNTRTAHPNNSKFGTAIIWVLRNARAKSEID